MNRFVRAAFGAAVLSAAGSVYTYDDLGQNLHDASGTQVASAVDLNPTRGYIGYFGVNISDGFGGTSAVVVLGNPPAPLPEPESLVLAGAAVAAAFVARRRGAKAARAAQA